MGTRGLAALVAVMGLMAWMPPAGWAQAAPANGRIYYDDAGMIVSVFADGSGRRLIRQGNSPAVDVTGTRVAYKYGDGIWMADADGSDPRQVTPEGVIGHNPDWSPDGKRLVYVRDNGSNGWMDIVVTDPSGETSINLTPGSSAYDADPSWSPDGQHVTFVSDRFGPFQLFRTSVEPDPKGPQRLTQTNGEWSQFPDWGPDGARIAFNHAFNHIYTVPAGGGTMTPLVENGLYPAWSPDGEEMAFARAANLWVRGADGKERPLTTSAEQVTLSDWSVVQDLPDRDGDEWSDGNDNCPADRNQDQSDGDGDGVGAVCDPDEADDDGDGSPNVSDNCRSVPNADQSDGDDDGIGDVCEPVGRIYYVEGSSPVEQRIVSVLPDGSERRMIAKGLAPAVDPAGERLAYQADGGVWLADVDGSDAQRLTPPGISAGLPVWSPDGERIAYVQDLDVWVTGAGLESPVNLTAGSGAYDAEPAWSPDGQSIIFASNRDGHLQLYRIPAHGDGAPTRLTFTETEPTQYADWHPSGDLIAYMQSDQEIRTLSFDVSLGDGYQYQGGEYAFQPGGLQSVVTAGRFPAWSPNGRQLAFGRADDLWVRAGDDEERALTTSKAGASHLDWTAVTDLPDRDRDTFADGNDNCPDDLNTDQADGDGDGVGDACDAPPDSDEDGVPDDGDNCVDVANADQKDSDGDGEGDVCDDDRDGDDIANDGDNCPDASNPAQADLDKDGKGDACDGDRDGDEVDNASDNCADVANANQRDLDRDERGDACDPDADDDGHANASDNCVYTVNRGQADRDDDGVGDACELDRDEDGIADDDDNCVSTPNADQADADADGVGDACDPDRDGDGVANAGDNCVSVANKDQEDIDADKIGDACDGDRDGDRIGNRSDNCPTTANFDQNDGDGDGLGDACDPQTTPPAAQQPAGGTAGFQQGSQEPPPPQVGESVTVRPARGKVYVRRPGQPPQELKEGETIPVGSIVDTRAGVVTLISAVPGGGRDTADFYDGVFRVLQDKTGLTELRLAEKLTCGSSKSTRGSSRGRARAAAGTQKRRLWGHGKGSFRTRGNYSAATVRGTWWLVEDTCASTTTSVREGVVAVRDLVRRQTVLVGAGKRYVARRR